MKIYHFNHVFGATNFDFSSDILQNFTTWDRGLWLPVKTDANHLSISPIHKYYANSLDVDNLGLKLPDQDGTLIFCYTHISSILDPDTEEYYYQFSWGASWYSGSKSVCADTVNTTLQDVLLGLEVEFIDHPEEFAQPLPLSYASNSVSSGNVIQWSGNYNWVPATSFIKII